MGLSGVVKYFFVLESIALTHVLGYTIEEYWQRGDEVDFIGTNPIGGMEYNNDNQAPIYHELQLLAKYQSIPKYSMSINELNMDTLEEISFQQIPVPASILKALEYINAHPDPQRHDESRRVKRF